MKTTQEYFNLTIDELLITDENNWTKEENLLYDEGLNCTFFDDEEEYTEQEQEFKNWLQETFNGIEVSLVLKTINERIAVISKWDKSMIL